MDAASIMPMERRGEERIKRTVFGVLECHGLRVLGLLLSEDKK
jgi:hypothetical protein